MLNLSDEARVHVEAYGLDLGWLEEASQPHPDADRSTEYARAPWGAEYAFHSSGIPHLEAGQFVAITQRDTGQIVGVHVVPVSILTDHEHGRPIAMLAKLAHDPRFRVEVSVWGNLGTYILPEDRGRPTVLRRVTGAPPGVVIVEPKGGVVVQAVVHNEEDGPVWPFLAFAVDAAAVRDAIGL